VKAFVLAVFCATSFLFVPTQTLRAAPATRPSTRPAAKPRTPDDAITPAPRDPKWVKRHEGFVKDSAAHKDSQLIFVGDSITDGWRGRPSFKSNYGKYDPIDLGLSGDRTEHVLYRLENGEIEGLHPKVAVVMIGTNNSGNDKPEWIAAGVAKIVEDLHTKLPDTKVLLLAIFPRGAKNSPARSVVNQTNVLLAKLDAPNTKYLDIGASFLDENGEISKEIMKDLLHPTDKGYDIWAKAMQPTLDDLMK
jgi:lysophospholipase L1-like esterase